MATRRQVILGLSAAAVVAAAPLVYSSHRNTHVRNLRVVEDGVLYRSGQLTPDGLDRVIRERDIRTVITLRASRAPGGPNPDGWEEDFCAARKITHYRITPRVWGADEHGDVPAEQAVREFLDVMDRKENYPVLVHCFAGVHRTGTMVAIFRMEYHHWPAERAIAEMKMCGFDPLDIQQHIEPYLRSYIPRGNRPSE